MKKNMKIASVVAAALFATAPVVSLTTAAPVSAASLRTVKNLTINDMLDHFIRETHVVDASTGQTIEQYPNHDVKGSLWNLKIKHGKINMNKYNRNHKLFVGKYHGSAGLSFSGLTPSTTTRKINFVTSDDEVVGTGVMKANSLTAKGYVNFSFSLSKNGTPSTAKFLGRIK